MAYRGGGKLRLVAQLLYAAADCAIALDDFCRALDSERGFGPITRDAFVAFGARLESIARQRSVRVGHAGPAH